MNISRQVVKFALRLLTLKIELTCMHFEISSTAFELGKYSIQQEDSTGKFAQESQAEFPPVRDSFAHSRTERSGS